MLNCSYCDAQYHKWQGRCAECGKWGTISQEETKKSSGKKRTSSAAAAPVLALAGAKTQQASYTTTNIDELDRVLGGGLVSGSVTLIAGEPGIGKSTLIAQLAAKISSKDHPAYYVSGEESEGQVLMRFERLKLAPDHIQFSNTVDIDSVLSAAQTFSPSVVVIDSIQTMLTEQSDSLPGTPTSVRAATAECISFAKQYNIPVVIIGQVTKEGSVAGPKTLEHLVDTVITLEGNKQNSYRLLYSKKNRFGSTDEVGVFEMTETGMQAVKNPSEHFLAERAAGPGSVITCIMEGNRPFLVEIQALTEKSLYNNPVRRTSGFDAARLQMLIAIIGKRAGVRVGDHDIYINVVGGMKVREPAVDLAVCAAIISSVKDKAFPDKSIILGELGLGGEVRSVPMLKRRLKEAERLGITKSYTPKNIKHIGDLFQK